MEVFTERGYEAATVAEIAERAGVTTGALYSQFRGKLDLLLASVGLKSVEDFARDSLPPDSVGRRRDAAGIAARSLARPASPESILLLDVIVAARRNARLATTLRRLLSAKVSEFVTAVESGLATGLESPTLRREDLARFMAMAAFGNLVLTAVGEDPPGEAALLRAMDALIFGGQDRTGSAPTEPLRHVGRSATALRDDRARFEEAVGAAGDAGYSLRQIAEAAGVSHERVRRVLAARSRERPISIG